MIRSSYKIATVWGIPIKVHISLIILLIVFCLEAARPAHGRAHALLNVLTALTLGVAGFASIALHELGHSFVAIRKGCRVRQITLMCIGGAAQMEEIPTRPRDELLMAIAGPAVSLVLGAIGLGSGYYLVMHADSVVAESVGKGLFYLGCINMVWSGFNLLPAFPMDGGRVLRALLTPRFGRLRATSIAAKLGQLLAVAGGVYAFYPPTRWVWVAMALFIYALAGNELQMERLQEEVRRRGFSIWAPFPDDNARRPDSDAEVRISPPPYRRGPDSHTEI
ncbi:site-2 protease family protein, partial [Verrucomicrobiota bacterium]